MTIFDYIKDSVDRLIEFKDVARVRYGVSEWTGAHLIEITPSEVLMSDGFLNLESTVVTEFEKLFPVEELIFISKTDIISLSESIYCVDNKMVVGTVKELLGSAKWTTLFNVNLVNPIYSPYFNGELQDYRLPQAA